MNNEYRIEFNGSSTWMVITNQGDCIFTTDTERKANNFLKRILKDAGLA
jgi:hypothetical protein